METKSAAGRIPRGSFAASLRALGADDLPDIIDLAGQRWHHRITVKHDFFAATGFYRSEDGQLCVVKINRVTDFLGLPLQWLGKILCSREVRCYQALHDVPNIPAFLGRVGTTGFMHAFIPGQPLARGMSVPDAFFPELETLLDTLRNRGIAYVDTNKPENILLGDDGRPYLIDFQINFALHDFGNHFLSRWWLNRMHESDLYHLYKHKRRLRPDQLQPDEALRLEQRGFLIRLHRFLTRPYFHLRRRTMQRLQSGGHVAEPGSN
ncbi:MAG: hypothetical protein IT448_04885 [Phycisphaerales bacterium]|nr:hypothetical protein [Phycisphaerales bacterium]